MFLKEFFRSPRKTILEGGNLEIGDVSADRIDSSKRAQVVPILDKALWAINAAYKKANNNIPLWMPSLLTSKKFLAGSSFHFFNRLEISDADFARVKRTVGDIDTQIDKNMVDQVRKWLSNLPPGTIIGPAQYVGMDDKDPAQVLTLWKFPSIVVVDSKTNQERPVAIQIDLEMKPFKSGAPTDWAQFSASSAWEDLSQGVKGVFHKWIIRALSSLTKKEFVLRKVGAKKTTEKLTTDNMISFAVKSKEGGGLRLNYQPVIDPDTGQQEIKGGFPVYTELPTTGYEQDISKIFAAVFGDALPAEQLKSLEPKFWSFIGIIELIKDFLSPEKQKLVSDRFVDLTFGKTAQRLYKNPEQYKQDLQEKNAAVNKMYEILGITPPATLDSLVQDYISRGNKQPAPVSEAETPAVKAQLRKGMPHLRDLKPADFLDLVDELRSEGGRFKLQNIPLNVKIDGFGGRFGKDASGKPFMATSRTEPRYQAGFLDYHKQKGTTDPEILKRSENFDKLFYEMMDAIKVVDSKLGPNFLVNKQVTCEVLFLPFATQTEEGKLKFVGIEYDQLPEGVELVLVPFRIVNADTGEEIPDGDTIVQEIADLGQSGNVMFMNNRLVQKDGLDVTEIINPLENLDELKRIVSDTAGKRDRASLQLRREVEEKLKPIQIALEKAIDEDPNIIGKDKLGQSYEGIVINSRLGPIKVTSQKQKDIIAQKQDLKKAARTERPRENQNKTAVVAIGSFIGHKGHEELFNYTVNTAKKLGGDPYLFIGNAEGKDDPIPPAIKVQTWHKLYPKYANNISTVISGGSLLQKVKHELINPLPGKPPRYDHIIIMVGEDRKDLTMPNALMKAVNKFPGYEHVKVELGITPRGTGISGTMLRNSLKNDTPEKALATWSNAFDVNKLGVDWIKHLMDVTRKGMKINKPETAAPQPNPVSERLFNALIRPRLFENVSAIARLNNIQDINKIQTGQQLKLPDGTVYTVAKGDTLSGIAAGQFKGSGPTMPTASQGPAVGGRGSRGGPSAEDLATLYPSKPGSTSAPAPASAKKEPDVPANAVRSSDGTPVKTGTGDTLTTATPAPDPKAVAAARAKLTPSQLKWLDGADPTDPAIMARMPDPLPGEKPAKPATGVPTISGDAEIMDMVKDHEGIRNRPYKDSKGLWTVGIGHLIGDGKTLPPAWNREFSDKEIMDLFQKDYQHHKAAATKIPGFNNLNTNGQAALIDLTFNMGPTWWQSWPNFTKAMQSGNIGQAANELINSKWYKQVGRRAPKIVSLLKTGSDNRAVAENSKKTIKEVTAQDIAKANNIQNVNLIKVGQQLKLPDGTTYIVKAGDNLTKIAASVGKTSTPAPAAPSPTSVPAAPPPQSSVRTGPNTNISQDTRQRAADFAKTNNTQNSEPPTNTTSAQAAKTTPNQKSTPDQTLAFGNQTGSKQNFDALQDPFQEKVEAAAAEYFAKTGKKLSITSAWRDPKDQERLYQQTIALGTPGIGPKGMAVGKPGTSKHEKGLAVDIQQYNDPIAVAALNKQGLYQTVKNDPVHFTLAEISDATKSSYKEKAQAQIKDLEPWTKKGEYRDLAKNVIARRERGLSKLVPVSEDVTKIMSSLINEMIKNK